MTAQITGAGLPTDGFLPQAGQQQAPAGGAPRPVALMLLYPELTLLDLIGPHTALAPAMDVHLVAETLDEVVSDTGVAIRPTTTLAGAPRDVDVLFVPGGPGTVAMMSDVEVLDFLADRGPRARYVTSVCSGSLILGAAGLLEGYRAGCHWTALDLLPLFGAQPSEDRVVTDRNRVTGGGVTAGIDFGLTLLAQMFGEDTAKLSQLAMEYDPKPPFDSGSPRVADPAHVALIRQMTAPVNDAAAQAAGRLHARAQG